ncbi:MAG: hypothetical protein MZW92_50540 [Comamonadaceae bacterium]|nr:hypothetical protein [Comamonadaceae bacterium]
MAAGPTTPTEYITGHLTHLALPVAEGGGFWTRPLGHGDHHAGRRRAHLRLPLARRAQARPPACRASARRSSSSSSTSSTARSRSIYHGDARAGRAARADGVRAGCCLMNAMDFLPVDVMAPVHAAASRRLLARRAHRRPSTRRSRCRCRCC